MSHEIVTPQDYPVERYPDCRDDMRVIIHDGSLKMGKLLDEWSIENINTNEWERYAGIRIGTQVYVGPVA